MPQAWNLELLLRKGKSSPRSCTNVLWIHFPCPPFAVVCGECLQITRNHCVTGNSGFFSAQWLSWPPEEKPAEFLGAKRTTLSGEKFEGGQVSCSPFLMSVSSGPWAQRAQLCLIRNERLDVTPLSKKRKRRRKEKERKQKKKPHQLYSNITWANLCLESFMSYNEHANC
jgi:hypothetical protein